MVCPSVVVARGVAVHNSPIFETEVTGDAGSVTLHLYMYVSSALVCVIACSLSLHKRSRLHFSLCS